MIAAAKKFLVGCLSDTIASTMESFDELRYHQYQKKPQPREACCHIKHHPHAHIDNEGIFSV